MNKRSKQVRRDAIKLAKANGGYHWGGSFSCTEILIDLYDHILTDDDIFILSKGHGCWCYYVLLREKGYNPKLEGHPSLDPQNGIYATTGSMGHGLPFGIGIALAKKLKKEKGRVFVLMGDGECQEGTTWESILIASKLKLDNLCVIIDYNKIQGSDFLIYHKTISSIYNTAVSNGWYACFDFCKDSYLEENKPKLNIKSTIKGEGVSFMENKPEWHSKWLTDELEQKALEELK